jgi:GT2 family glycosyltransferase
LVGVAGTQYLMRHKPAWVAAGRPFIRGRVAHEMADGRQILTLFSAEEGTSEVVAVDGLFFAIRRSLFDHIAFDEQSFSGFHFYDMDICMQVRRSHKLVVTSDILVKHLSGGNFGEAWREAAENFMNKYAAQLPAFCCAQIPDLTRRIDFESLDMATLLSPHALDVVKAVGH